MGERLKYTYMYKNVKIGYKYLYSLNNTFKQKNIDRFGGI